MKLYDTLTGSKRDFAPVDGDVKMYVCGPNLYGPCHVGHALSYVIFDVLRRYLEYQGYRVRHVQNFTDIEDRIIETATAEGLTIGDLAEHYINRFLEEANHDPKPFVWTPDPNRILAVVDRGRKVLGSTH